MISSDDDSGARKLVRQCFTPLLPELNLCSESEAQFQLPNRVCHAHCVALTDRLSVLGRPFRFACVGDFEFHPHLRLHQFPDNGHAQLDFVIRQDERTVLLCAETRAAGIDRIKESG